VKILALITARGGSKRLPGKNVRLLDGIPLIAWSINVVKDIEDVCDILVTTDDPVIADVAAAAGASVPWLRPSELATDTATSVDVSLHALDWYESIYGPIDGLLLLQPTSPFRRRETIIRGLDLFKLEGHRPVLGVSPALSHPMWCFEVRESVLHPFFEDGINRRSQDLPPAYEVNGAFYLITPSDLRKRRSFYTPEAKALVIEDPLERIDIDTQADWSNAESALGTFKQSLIVRK
jgi:CMP-N,N'-diacetyllegionaminic acid synthase